MGVLPRNTMAWSASTRPRMAGADSICTMAVDAVMKVMLAMPTTRQTGRATATLGTRVSTAIMEPKAMAASATSRTEMEVRRAAANAPNNEPRAVAEYSNVNRVAQPPRLNLANNGNTTWKLRI